ncbi:Harbinger transposase-derived nuclease [Cynara cardunculus var. scolymus]|uniref:Harbinger transposase-derived nuclease n=1 Tax=Cynara cardunculus var. scolymus TaxID=59895 RepID=A0A118JZA7_CYNCS|nr:Harbinger transposase-derived nuclease [Cynara cardunculus var. scolymus]
MNDKKPMQQRRRKVAKKTEVADMEGKQEIKTTSLFFLDQEKPGKHDDVNCLGKRKSRTPSIVPDVAVADLGYDLNLGGGGAAVKGGGDGPQRRLWVCSAIKDVLMPKYLQWPNDDSIRVISNEFDSVSGIPNVVGSMYTTHIPIIAPKVNVSAYFNKCHTEKKHKTCYSVTIQGVVDPSGVFTDVCIGWPGSMPDDQVLENSALYQRAMGGLLKGVWIVGGCGYPLMDWVLVPYKQPHLTWTQHAFNEKIGEIQKVSKDAFARLKGRWSCLQKRTEMKLQDLPVVLGACCVLHNICEIRSEKIESQLMIEVVDDEMVPENGLRSPMAMKARDSMAHNLLHHNHAGTSFLS